MSDVGLPDVGLHWKWVSAAFGEVLDQAVHKSPTNPHNPRACAKENIHGASLTQAWCLVS